MNRIFKKRISLRQSIYIAKRVSFLLEAGIPLPKAFLLLADQMKTRGAILERIAESISNGQSITDVISQTKLFGASAMPMIKIGEESGTLAEAFSALSDELEKQSLLKQKVLGAVLYPACIMVGMLILVIVLMTAVFPKMLGVFQSLQVSLPLSTRLLMWLSNCLCRYGVYIGFIILAGIVVFGIFYRRSSQFHFEVDRVIIKIPLLSILVRTYMLASISNIIGLLLTNNSALPAALDVTARTCGNYAYRKILRQLAEQVSDGLPLGQALLRFPWFFSKEYGDLISIGEQTGKLAETFTYAHTLYSRDLDILTKSLSASIEPILMVVIGLAIGVVAFSVVTPMYSITSHLHGT